MRPHRSRELRGGLGLVADPVVRPQTGGIRGRKDQFKQCERALRNDSPLFGIDAGNQAANRGRQTEPGILRMNGIEPKRQELSVQVSQVPAQGRPEEIPVERLIGSFSNIRD
jgi:hypothetical protein